MLRRFSIKLLAMGLFILVPPQAAIAQESRSDKIYDEILLEVSEVVPEFAGVLGGGTTLKILVTAQRPGMIEELREALDKAFGKSQFEMYTDAVLLDAKYSWIQLMDWYEQLRDTVWSFEGISASDIDERENRIAIGVIDPETQAAAVEDEAERLGIPDDAIVVEKQGYVQPLGGTADQQRRSEDGRGSGQSDGIAWWLGGAGALILLAAVAKMVFARRGRNLLAPGTGER